MPQQAAQRLLPLRIIAPVSCLALAFFAAWSWAVAGRVDVAVLSGFTAVLAALAARKVYLRRRNPIRAGLLLSVANALGAMLAAWELGESGLAWSYLVLMANFFIVQRAVSIPVNLLLTAGLLSLPGVLLRPLHISELVVVGLILALGLYLSRHLQNDRTHMEQLALRDTLTRLPNRRLLEDTLNQLINDPRQSRFHHALVVLDIDHFKEVNDLHGHRAGDIALADLAAILRFELRDGDQAFRFGGEEFVALVEVPDREALATLAERLRKAVFQSLRGPGGRITISLGGAMYAGEPHWQDWFSRADTALYLAKNAGRNSYVIAEDL